MDNNENPIKKKRGRKPKNQKLQEEQKLQNAEPVAPKKRGRKPKGGKLINKIIETNERPIEINNVILHLKCSLNDIKPNNFSMDVTYNPDIPPAIESFSDTNNYASFNSENIIPPDNENNFSPPIKETNNNPEDFKLINNKLKLLKMQLFKGDNNEKKSACFWCTYEFDNSPCYIPIQNSQKEITGYGSFCRPECATAYLFKENIDDSIKFERYHLLNKCYGEIYDYNKSIKPSPDPHYTLDKFFGNLSIKEYRKLLKSDHMLVTLEKPFSKSLPELHEENDVLVSDIYGCGNPNKQSLGTYKVKRESEKQKGPTKSKIIAEKFGIKN